MKRFNFIMVSVLVCSAGFSQTTVQGFEIDGKIPFIPDNTVVIFSGMSGKDTLAKTTVKNGTFVLRGRLASPDAHIVSFPSIQKGFQLFMGNDHVAVNGAANDFSDLTITGSPSNYDFEEFIHNIVLLGNYVKQYQSAAQAATTQGSKDSAVISLNTVYSIFQQSIDQFLARKRNSPVAPLLLQYSYEADPNKDANTALLQKRFALLGGEALQSQFAKNVKELLIGAVGTPAMDFTQNDTTGKPVSLSQFKGKYVLVDFWASWCRPCRAENPNVVAAYNQYKNKNFTILSVSLDQRKENWEFAINADGLTWNHVSDLQYWSNAVARTYHIETIPSNFLVDPNGTIIAKNLRGEELANKLAELLK